MRDLTASLLNEVCHNVTTEPQLQSLSGEQLGPLVNKDENAHVDVRASSFWGIGHEGALFNIRVFHPFVPSYRGSTLSLLYRQHKSKKRKEYGQQVREVEHGSFTPLVFTTGGGMAAEAIVFSKILASMLSEKRGESYSCVMGWLRCTISFCLLWSSLVSIRGTRLKMARVDCEAIAEAIAESLLKY